MVKEIFGFILPFLDSVSAIRGILGFVLVFFLPGFAWSLVFFRSRQINIVERLVLSVGISIAIVTLCILGLNILLDISITGINSVMIILVITIIPLVWYFFKRFVGKQ